jgi:polysaccharide biosynthesis protein PslH
MKVLFLTPQLPYPPHKGTTLRNYHLIRHVAARHETHLLSFVAPGDDPAHIDVLNGLCRSVTLVDAPIRTKQRRAFDALTSPWPDMGLRLWSDAYAERLCELLAAHRFDVVQVEGIELARYAQRAALPAANRPRLTVLDEHNAEAALQRRVFLTDLRRPRRWVGAAYSLVQWHKLRRFEAWALRGYDCALAVSPGDAAELEQLAAGAYAAIVPNGVDTDYYARGGFGSAELSGWPRLVFTGSMDFRPNVDAVTWFCAEVLPRLAADFPEVRFYIVGGQPNAAVSALAADPRVTVTGWVPDERPYVAASDLYVVPMRMGGGVRFKVLIAMSMETPVVSTGMGADGIDARPGRDYLRADSADEFARAVASLLRDPARRADLVTAGRALVTQHYDWRVILPGLDEVYARADRV